MVVAKIMVTAMARIVTNIRPLSKLAYAEGVEGDSERRTVAYLNVREDSSTESTYKSPAKARYRKGAIDIAASLVKRFEGLALTPYICAGGEKTIGYGHVMSSYDEDSFRHQQISGQLAESLLREDLHKSLRAVQRCCPVQLTKQQQAALISFTFNCGGGALQASTLRQKLVRGEYILAAGEFLKWVYAGGVKLKGLVRRRIAERDLFLAGLYQDDES